MTDNTKINPKSLDANVRVPLNLVPAIAIAHTAAVLKEGSERPGRWPWNWRDAPTNLTDYLDAAQRHLAKMQDGEWLDEEDGEPRMPHAAKVAASMFIALDADACGTLIHDVHELTAGVSQVLQEYSRKYKERQAAKKAADELAVESQKLGLYTTPDFTTLTSDKLPTFTQTSPPCCITQYPAWAPPTTGGTPDQMYLDLTVKKLDGHG